ncbi:MULTISPECIES: sensor histidine kinase KdpD [unclassified Rhodococcus (in: high G+C Gram-positive bacteria)]|uniref:sensor histidine kinase n=1 Tax=unclassified Rhodococcus (in: high G+C Gram-positive bacteria) TaxID=192944 RepID=UPI000BC800E3|nr:MULTISPECIES: HAMP domain-containing sensor histidine kinase [unclassified Rhodococcus (in: high G+C Gram-positive bacteria)]MBP1159083.1 signal transduction histidine kinase [Rhodococcus sp. PvR099]PTR39044.1 signal transduction histidine kinase [Rhodococcus sp. OK611]SNX92830.1 Signal transduction histidine kinase [Rhodococcus sp. OK270]
MRRRPTVATRPAAVIGDEQLLRRAGRLVALQAAAALALVLLVVGLAMYLVDARFQSRQIDTQLRSVVEATEDVDDPPPGTALALRGPDGMTQVSADAPPQIAGLLDGPAGFSDLRAGERHYRALVGDNTHGRVAAALDLEPFEAGRHRLLAALVLAEITGIAASSVVVVLLSRRSIRPLTLALSLQRRFVADASHELRAPLTVLHTRAQLLARRVGQLEPEEVSRQLDGIVADTRALGELVEDLLLSAALETGPDTREPVDVAALCEQVRDSVEAHARSLGVDVDVDVEHGDAPCIVSGSRPALRRAVHGLVDNAVTHVRPGGRVTLHVDGDTDLVRIAVTDTGTGIEPRQLDRLFTRFAHGPEQPAGGRRYGIGLALVREIATAHDGEILVDPRNGRGATFTLVLPRHP